MTTLCAQFVSATCLTAADIGDMVAVMRLVYDGVNRGRFEADLADKDECIVLRDSDGRLVGFSTQRHVSVRMSSAVSQLPQWVSGIFSGDTVLHPQHWGGGAPLFRAFVQAYVADRDVPLYWFLTSKGHRTYRMLPVFFQRFYPDRRHATPPPQQAIMAAYAGALYGTQYDPDAGVIAHHQPADRLRPGMAGVSPQLRRNPDVAYFEERNPGHVVGHDLVCLTELSTANLKPAVRDHLFATAPITPAPSAAPVAADPDAAAAPLAAVSVATAPVTSITP